MIQRQLINRNLKECSPWEGLEAFRGLVNAFTLSLNFWSLVCFVLLLTSCSTLPAYPALYWPKWTCTEIAIHNAVTFASEGYPARIQVGLSSRGGHAVAEAYVEGEWLPLRYDYASHRVVAGREGLEFPLVRVEYSLTIQEALYRWMVMQPTLAERTVY